MDDMFKVHTVEKEIGGKLITIETGNHLEFNGISLISNFECLVSQI